MNPFLARLHELREIPARGAAAVSRAAFLLLLMSVALAFGLFRTPEDGLAPPIRSTLQHVTDMAFPTTVVFFGAASALAGVAGLTLLAVYLPTGDDRRRRAIGGWLKTLAVAWLVSTLAAGLVLFAADTRMRNDPFFSSGENHTSRPGLLRSQDPPCFLIAAGVFLSDGFGRALARQEIPPRSS